MSGWLGVPSFGRSTFVTVACASEADRSDLVHSLAAHFVDVYGAPNLEAARPFAEEEVAYAATLADEAEIGAVFALTREHDENGEIREAIRSIPRPGNCGQSRVWDVMEES